MYNFQELSKYKKELDYKGIYLIFCDINSHIYVGSTRESFYKRAIRHLWDLKKNHHHSNYLQNSFNKYKESNFYFCIILILNDITKIQDLEQHYIDLFKPEYNMCKYVKLGRLGIKKDKQFIKKFTEIHRNIPITSSNKSGYKGISWCDRDSRWIATICYNKKNINLGSFINIEEAIQKRKEAQEVLWSESFEELSLEEKGNIIKNLKHKNPRLTNKLNERFIYKDHNKYVVEIKHIRYGSYNSLEEAIIKRDSLIS